MLLEIFKVIPEYPSYKVSNWGRVWSNKSKKFLKLSNNRGYQGVTLCGTGKPKPHDVHRLVALAFLPNPEGKPRVNHIDCTRGCNFVWNLEWVTDQEDTNHRMKYGVLLKGDSHPNVRITDAQVKEIRQLLEEGNFLQKEIAKLYNTVPSVISNIKQGKTRKHS